MNTKIARDAVAVAPIAAASLPPLALNGAHAQLKEQLVPEADRFELRDGRAPVAHLQAGAHDINRTEHVIVNARPSRCTRPG